MNSTNPAASPAQLRYLATLAAKGHKPAQRLLQQGTRGAPITMARAGATIDDCKR